MNYASWRSRTLDLIAESNGTFRLRLHGGERNRRDRSLPFSTYKSALDAFRAFPERFSWAHQAPHWDASPETYA